MADAVFSQKPVLIISGWDGFTLFSVSYFPFQFLFNVLRLKLFLLLQQTVLLSRLFHTTQTVHSWHKPWSTTHTHPWFLCFSKQYAWVLSRFVLFFVCTIILFWCRSHLVQYVHCTCGLTLCHTGPRSGAIVFTTTKIYIHWHFIIQCLYLDWSLISAPILLKYFK